MSDILIVPKYLRQTARNLRASSWRIEAALEFVDGQMRQLEPDRFEGNRADSIREYYRPVYGSLHNSINRVLVMAQQLEDIASEFEKTDEELARWNYQLDSVGLESAKQLIKLGFSGLVNWTLDKCKLIAAGSSQSAAKFWQVWIDSLNINQLISERNNLLSRIAAIHKELANLPSLEQLATDLQENVKQQALVRSEIERVNQEIDSLLQKRDWTSDQAKRWFNSFLPSKEFAWDSEDGLPWRVRADDFEDDAAVLQSRLDSMAQQRTDLAERLSRLETTNDQLTATQVKVDSLQTDLNYEQQNLDYISPIIEDKSPAISNGLTLSIPDGAYDVTPINQLAIRYQNLPGTLACVPTSMAMITQYYHSLDSKYQPVSPVELIEMQEPDAEGYSMMKGSSPSIFEDDLMEKGYSYVQQPHGSIETLQTLLKSGPVIAITKMSSGNTHAVVVTGSSEGRISIADPWEGANRVYTDKQFLAMWKSADDGWLITVRPE